MSEKSSLCDPSKCRAIGLLREALRRVPYEVPDGVGGFHRNLLYYDIVDYLKTVTPSDREVKGICPDHDSLGQGGPG